MKEMMKEIGKMIKWFLKHLLILTKGFLKILTERLLLTAADKVSSFLSVIITYVILAMFSFFILLFANIGAAILLSAYFNNPYAGYFIVAGFYLLFGLVIFIVRKKLIKKPIMNYFISIIKPLINKIN